MRILTLPVDDSVADGYNNVPPLEKEKINSAINTLLSKFLKTQQDSAFFNAINELSGEAAKNDLTVEKLGKLMEWDEDTLKNLFGEEYHKTNAR